MKNVILKLQYKIEFQRNFKIFLSYDDWKVHVFDKDLNHEAVLQEAVLQGFYLNTFNLG